MTADTSLNVTLPLSIVNVTIDTFQYSCALHCCTSKTLSLIVIFIACNSLGLLNSIEESLPFLTWIKIGLYRWCCSYGLAHTDCCSYRLWTRKGWPYALGCHYFLVVTLLLKWQIGTTDLFHVSCCHVLAVSADVKFFILFIFIERKFY